LLDALFSNKAFTLTPDDVDHIRSWCVTEGCHVMADH
jgi:hypothetical protein